MNKTFCDICGRDIQESSASRYKIKKLEHSFHESWWERLDVHDKCWRDLAMIIKKQRSQE